MPDQPLPRHVDLSQVPLDDVATAGYNFVPLPDLVVPAVQNADELPDHDCFYPASPTGDQPGDRFTGAFTVKLTTHTKTYVRCALRRERYDAAQRGDERDTYADQAKNTPDFFYTYDAAEPVIPGPSLHGMVRGLLEVASYSKFSRVAESPRLSYRAVANTDDPRNGLYTSAVRLGKNGINVKAGYLEKSRRGWLIRPAKPDPNPRWRSRKGYYRAKETLALGVIPGLEPFASDDYTPGYFSVRFDAERRYVPIQNGRRTIPVVVATDIGLVTSTLPHKGTLVCSGNMLLGNINPGDETLRSHHTVIPEPDPSKPTLSIAPEALNDYRATLTDFQKSAFDEKEGMLQQGRPVFYVAPPNGGDVRFFGHSPNFRIPYVHPTTGRPATPLDYVPARLRGHEVDYAEALFGFVHPHSKAKQGSKARAYKSRLSVSDATLDPGQKGPDLFAESFTPRVLSTPQASAFAMYLTQPDHDARNLHHYETDTPEKTVVRGTKLYHHQPDPEIDALCPEPGSPNTDDQGHVDPESKIHTQIKPVNAGKTFTFTVRFKNLLARELGALCWALHPQGDDKRTYLHKLGMAKGFGLGSVHLDATLTLDDRPARYTTLFEGNRWLPGIKEGPLPVGAALVQERFIQPFEHHILRTLRQHFGLPETVNALCDLKRIGILLKMLDAPDTTTAQATPPGHTPLRSIPRPPARYMDLEAYGKFKVLPCPSSYGGLTGTAEPGRATAPSPSTQGSRSHGSRSEGTRPRHNDAPPPARPRPEERRGGGRPQQRPPAPEKRTPLATGPRKTGTVKWFNPVKGFGFIMPDDRSRDVFLHINNCRERHPEPREGDRLTFVVENTPKGLSAVDVERLAS